MDHERGGEREEHDIEVEGGGAGGYNGNYIYSQRRKLIESVESGISDDHEKEFSVGDHHLREPLLLKRRTNTTSQLAIVGANICPIESLDYEYVCTSSFALFFTFLLTGDVEENG